MRRRVWASVVQMDLRISVQMGLPCLIKIQQCDTEEPRNLLGSTVVELPPSRPETEITPVLYRLAKNRIDIAGGLISDLLVETREQPYPEIMSLDQKLQAAEAALPPIFRWQPLNLSSMAAPQVVLHRIWLQLGIQRLIICLHRKHLAPSYAQDRYSYSRNACVQPAIKILQFQQLIGEEIQPGGQLHPVRWMQSWLLQFSFLLSMSVLCYHIQLSKPTAEVQLNNETKTTIYSLLRSTYPLLLRSSAVSQDARKAVEHLRYLQGLRSELGSTPSSHESMDNLAVPQDAPISIDQITWDTYQECIANFPSTSDADFTLLNTPDSSPMVSVPMTDLIPESPNEVESWIKTRIK